tara:strand:- start:854 stop:1111 length:258 start_codon:yes stop_codon:yes gene_type:complete
MAGDLGLLGQMGGRKRRYKTGKIKRRKSNAGKRKTKRVRRKSMKGGSMGNALLPLGLLSLQQFFMNKSRKNKSIIPRKIKKTLKL